MCGIVGVLGRSEESGKFAVQSMLPTIRHRGPDSQGTFSLGGLALGVNRLSIVDLNGGQQPIRSDRGNVIVMNGEIYNFRELREELSGRGHRFENFSDTEVVLKAYEEWGLHAPSHLNGMFAVAIFDQRKQKLVLFRDRMGKKPLYLRRDSLGFVQTFASELKAIIADPSHVGGPEIDQQSLFLYLGFRFIPGPATIWKGVSKLAPGSIVEVDLRSRQEESLSYWSLPSRTNEASEVNVSSESFDDLFLDSVRKRISSSDVPVGVLLSGGLDSASVAAAAVEVGARDTKCFSIRFEDSGSIDETAKARSVGEYLGLEVEVETVTRSDFFEFLPLHARMSDEPLADLSSIPMYFLTRRVAPEFKVALTGEGSDEVLAGYDFNRQIRRLRVLGLALKVRGNSQYLSQRLDGRQKSITAAGSRPTEVLRHFRPFISREFTCAELRDHWVGEQGLHSSEGLIESAYEQSTSTEILGAMQSVYLGDWLVEDLLMKSDKMSMANSVELRCPFLDFRLVEWSFRQKSSALIGRFPHFHTKRPLRDFARSRLPDSIVNQRKLGFPVPCYEWISEGYSSWAEERLLGDQRLAEFLSLESLVAHLRSPSIPTDRRQRLLWNLLILSYWFEAWL